MAAWLYFYENADDEVCREQATFLWPLQTNFSVLGDSYAWHQRWFTDRHPDASSYP